MVHPSVAIDSFNVGHTGKENVCYPTLAMIRDFLENKADPWKLQIEFSWCIEVTLRPTRQFFSKSGVQLLDIVLCTHDIGHHGAQIVYIAIKEGNVATPQEFPKICFS